MKHQVAGYKLNRDHGHRRALYKNLITSLISHGAITTTLTKAKAIQGQVDSLVSQAKKGQVHARREIDRVLNNTATVNRLVDVIAPAVGKRQSGFTRIIKLGPRRGDAAHMARLEFVDTVPSFQAQVSQKPNKKETTAKKIGSQTKKKTPTATPTKAASPTPKDHDDVIPGIAPQAAMKPGMLRRKSGER